MHDHPRRAQTPTRFSSPFLPLALLASLLPASATRASDLLFETTQMGPANYPAGLSISSQSFLGARFQLSTPATIDAVGGHLFGLSSGNDQIFAALISLTSLTDTPDTADLSSPDVLAHTTFQPPSPSADTSTPIGPVSLPAGDYAVVFGSGLFGATGSAAAPDDNVPNDFTAQYNLKYTPSFGWDRIGNRGIRFTVYGTVPEPTPAAAALILLPAALLIPRRRRAS